MDLEDLRQRIDQLDDKIVELLNERARIVVQVGKVKNADGAPIYSPDREKAVLERIRRSSKGPLGDKSLVAIYRELMSGSFALQKSLRIAYLGPQGSYSHLAATGHFGASVEYEAVKDIRGVFEEVARGRVNFGMVPVENSTGGGVIDTLDAFIETDVQICAEVNRAIHHNLLSRESLENINRVYSKPEVFSQCQRWLSETGFAGQAIPVASTSKAAEMARDEPGSAAIGSTLAAQLYNLRIVTQNVEDNVHNVTRFFVIGLEPAKPTGDDKTALMFTTQHRAGALVDVLNVFRDVGINLTMITSRPSKKRNWEYYFFVDAEGHATNPDMKQAIHEAKKHCIELNVLGSFPRAAEVL